jgi:hypothetical protein
LGRRARVVLDDDRPELCLGSQGPVAHTFCGSWLLNRHVTGFYDS